jgi:hypothetical protein
MAVIAYELSPGPVVWLMDILRHAIDPESDLAGLMEEVEAEGWKVVIEFVEGGASCPADDFRIYLARDGGKEVGDASPCDRLVNALRRVVYDPIAAGVVRDVIEEGFDVCVEFVLQGRFDEHRIHLVRK